MSGHSNWPEWIYVGVVIALMCWVGAEAWNAERLVEHVPEGAEVIKVTGQQWFWTFEHEDGTKEIGELHVEVGKAYTTSIRSIWMPETSSTNEQPSRSTSTCVRHRTRRSGSAGIPW